MSTEGLLHISIAIRRKDGVSKDEFHRHWALHHGPLVSEWLKRSGIVKYTQCHSTTPHQDMGKTRYEPLNREVSDFDGRADLYVRSFEDWHNAFKDPEYMEKIHPDENRFVDLAKCVITVGSDRCFIEHGDIVTEHKDMV